MVEIKNKSFIELVRKRRSIRAFQTRVFDIPNALKTMLQVCDMAPSSGGLQSFEIYVVDDIEKRRQLVDAARDQTFVAQAPLNSK